MIKALLFDLDDTLLGNEMGTFLPAYFQQVVRHFPEVDSQALLNSLIAGTQAMLANADPTRTLRSVFSDHFSVDVNGDAWERFDRFYRTDFARLQPLTTSRPSAREVLAWAFAAGYRVVVATSPVFPLRAIRERLRWAKLDDLPFEIITHIENSHFTKPHPEYFAEILAGLGLRPDEAFVVGNDWSDDLVPAAALGLPHWWIAAPDCEPPSSQAAPVGVGDLSAFLRWAQAELAQYQPPPPPPGWLTYQLTGNLAHVMSELADLDAAAWTERPAPDDWSFTEIICHLRDVDREVHLQRIQAVLTTDNPFISGAVTDPWATERSYQTQSGPLALQAFAAARQEIVQLLSAQPETAWARPARHALFGPSTLAEIVGWLLDHDRIHLEQIRTAKAKLV